MSEYDAQVTRSVLIEVTLTDGTPVEDKAVVEQVVRDLSGIDPELASDGCGGWLATVPADWYAEASEDGGILLTHSGGYVFNIPC